MEKFLAEEKRLIDANELTNEITQVRNANLGFQGSIDAVRYLDRSLKIIENAPTVDAVEVVMCKDCKYWLKDVPGCTEHIGRCELARYMVGAVGFCVYGERKGKE